MAATAVATNQIRFEHKKDKKADTLDVHWYVNGGFEQNVTSGNVIEWRNEKGTNFAVVVPSSGAVAWATADGSDWDSNLPCCFDDTEYWIKNAVAENGVYVVRLIGTSSSNTKGVYAIVAPPPTELLRHGRLKKLAMPFDYYMVDATLVWSQ
jgi:hypothetical protein